MSELRTPVALIAAVARNGVIGRDNQMPWRLPGELQYFKATTLGKPVVMGRKTFVSIGRPLPGRSNIVISRDRGYHADGVAVAHTLNEALALADVIAVRDGAAEIMVIGGAEIYRLALPLAQIIYLTEVLAEVEGDAWFPTVDWSQWRCEEQRIVEGDPPYRIAVYRRA
jgi:dihydrofolate reductase